MTDPKTPGDLRVKIQGWDRSMAPREVDEDDADTYNSISMGCMSNAFIYNATLVWHGELAGEEYVSYPYETYLAQLAGVGDPDRSSDLGYIGIIGSWSTNWQSRGLRRGLFAKSLRGSLARFAPKSFDAGGFETDGLDVDIHLLPKIGHTNYLAHAPFYHVLPAAVRRHTGLPTLGWGTWPPMGMGPTRIAGEEADLNRLPVDFDARVANAFSRVVWPFLRSDRRGSRIEFFDKREPLVVLAHNLDFWLPHMDRVLKRRMAEFLPVEDPEKGTPETLAKLNSGIAPETPARFERPLKGGDIFFGEEDALEVVREMVEEADREGGLRALVDVIERKEPRTS